MNTIALVGVGAAVLIPMLGGFFYLGRSLGKIGAEMVTKKDLSRAMDRHRETCSGSPFYKGTREATNPAIPLPPPLPPGR